MPIVPTTGPSAPLLPKDAIGEQWLLMAAGQMHEMGRLVEPEFSSQDRRYSKIPMLEMPIEIYEEAYGKSQWKSYINRVNEYIAENGLKKDDMFRIMHPDGDMRLYKYLGPSSGGENNWLELKNRGES